MNCLICSKWKCDNAEHLLDSVVKYYIKCRDGWCCAYCTAGFPVDSKTLTWSHFHRVSHQATRHDEENLDAFCQWCHVRLESKKNEGGWYWEWKKNQLGDDKFFALGERAGSIVKVYDTERLEKVGTFIHKVKLLGYDTKDFNERLALHLIK